MITAIYGLALTTGASRVVKGKRIEHVLGDPNLGVEKDRAYSLRLVRTALKILEEEVSGPTFFDPDEYLKGKDKEGNYAA
jgi:hypothetical protein